MDTTRLPVGIRRNIYSGSLGSFLKEVSASVAKRLNYSSRECKTNLHMLPQAWRAALLGGW